MPGLQPTGAELAELSPADRFGMMRAMAENLALLHELTWSTACHICAGVALLVAGTTLYAAEKAASLIV